MALQYFRVDPINLNVHASFSGGQMRLSVNAEWHDMTPEGGVPLLGSDGECPGAQSIFTTRRLYYPTTPQLLLRGEYTGGQTGLEGLTASGSGVGLVSVRDTPLRIQKNPGGVTLSFYGTATRYAIQRSTNLRDWTQVDIRSPDANARVELTLTGDGFWRYQRL